MKLKRNCVFFNAKVNENGRTPDWGHELGQGDGYLMKENGCSEIINGLVYNIKNPEGFSYGSGGNSYDFEIVSVFNETKVEVYDSEQKTTVPYVIKNPFILIIAKENRGVHVGRRTLKMNVGFTYGDIRNSEFYDAINKIVPEPWFGYKLEYDNNVTGQLILTIIKAPNSQPIADDPDIKYVDARSRKEIWDKLADEYYVRTRNFSDVEFKIFFGAPGTGKSYIVKEQTKKAEEQGRVERITFHPEYDYASFVGSYKPTMVDDDIHYKFVPQAFTNIYTKAWNDIDNKHFLIIEEINRGNCAEIFGDIFQLLDRNSNYTVTPSEDLKKYLESELNGKDAERLLLPPNLSILATMNTSDQSLFPMDSAFKRRWDWEYVPIDTEKSEKNLSSKFRVKLSETESFSWLEFITSVNKIIRFNDNLGMDKCIGNYFINPDEKTYEISLKTFVNKAIFYLWNDVFKDEMEDDSIFKNKTTYEDFFPIEEGANKVREILEFLEVRYEKPEE